QFTVDLGTVNHTGSAVTVNYTVTGTATNGGTDYTSLSGSVSIADGQQTATIDVAGIIDDALVEGNETVIVRLDTTDSGLFTIDGSNNSDTVTVADNDTTAVPTVTRPIGDQSASEDSAFTFQFATDTFSDADGDTLRYTAKLSDNSDLPTWLSFDANTRTFSGTPTSNDIGEINIQVTASDGASTVSDIFKLTINNVNDAPVAADDEYSIDEDNTLSIAAEGVLNNDRDEDSDPLSAVLVDPPSHGVLTFNSDGSFDYVPDPDFNGEDTFTYKATDGELESNLARVNLLVNAIDDEPVTHDESFDVDFEEPLSIDIANDILFNDSDVDSDKLNLIGFTQPEHGELTDNGDGTLSYRPHTGFSGIDHFVYTFSDGLGGTGQATATINVSRNGPSADERPQDTDLADLEAGYKQQEDYFKEPVIDVFRYSEQPVWQSSELTSIDNNESNLKDDGSSASRVDETSESESALDLFNLRDEKYYQVFQQVREVSQVTNEYSSGITVYAKSISGSIARPLGSSEGETDSEAPDSRSEVLNNQAMWRAIDLMKSQMDDTRDSDMVLQGIVGATLTFSAGSVTWLLRGGSLMASFLSSVPVWTNFDPLPVLTSPEKSRRERKVKANSESKPQEVPLDSLFDTSGTSQTSQEKG
ncbi:MAG: tandem-95 repeat protein, partial [Methylococcales bacterium]